MKLTPVGVRTYARAIKDRWPLGEALRAKVMQRLEEALDDDDKRIVVAAAKTITDADKINLAYSLQAAQEVEDEPDIDIPPARMLAGLARLAAPRATEPVPASDGGTGDEAGPSVARSFEFDAEAG